jgi:hypothetical protein
VAVAVVAEVDLDPAAGDTPRRTKAGWGWRRGSRIADPAVEGSGSCGPGGAARARPARYVGASCASRPAARSRRRSPGHRTRGGRPAGGEEPLRQVVGQRPQQRRDAVALGVLVADRVLADVAPGEAADDLLGTGPRVREDGDQGAVAGRAVRGSPRPRVAGRYAARGRARSGASSRWRRRCTRRAPP